MNQQELLDLAREIRATIKEEVGTAHAPCRKQIADLLTLVGELQGKWLAYEQKISALEERLEAVAKEPRVVIEQPDVLIPPAPPANVFLPEAKPRKPRKYRVTARDEEGRIKSLEEIE